MLGDRRLRRDLERWEQSGWVTAPGARAIRTELGQSGTTLSLANVLAVLAAVLLCLGAMTFVAANWQEMSRLGRLVLLLAMLAGSYGGAAWLYGRGLEGFGHAATMLGCGSFGASIMLVAQMYHIGGNPPDAVLTWGAGTAAAAILLRANAAHALAIGLAGLWGAWETALRGDAFWPYLLAWVVLFAGLALTTRWRAGFHLLALSLTGFVISLGYLLAQGHRHDLVLLIGLAGMAVAAFLGPTIDRFLALSRPALVYALATAYAGLFAMQFLEGLYADPASNTPWLAANGMPLLALAVTSLAIILGALFLANRSGNRGLLWVAYCCFSLELIGLYFKTLGTLLDTSLFFLVAGLLLAGLAYLALRLHRRDLAHREA